MHTALVTRDCPVETRVHLAFQIQQSTFLPKNITIILIIPRKNVPEDKCSCVAGTISPTSLIHCSKQQHHWTSMVWTKLQKMLLKQKADEHFKSAASFNSPANIRMKRKLSMKGRLLGIYLKAQTFPKYLIRPPL